MRPLVFELAEAGLSCLLMGVFMAMSTKGFSSILWIFPLIVSGWAFLGIEDAACADKVRLPDGMNQMHTMQMPGCTMDEEVQQSNLEIQRVVDQLGSAFHIGGDPIYGRAANHQFSPALSFDGMNYLAVWEDTRSSSGSSDVYAARIDTAGNVIDLGSIIISAAENTQNSPAIAFDGMNHMIVWCDLRNGVSDIYMARVTANGVLLDPDGIAVASAAYEANGPALAFDGTNHLVVWQDYRNGNWDIYGSRVSTAGIVLDPDGVAISTAPNEQCSATVSFDGTNYLVAWEDYRGGSWDVYGSRVSTDGVVLDPSGIAISTEPDFQASPAVAFDGMNHLVVWHDNRAGEVDIFGARVTISGVVLDAGGIPVSTAEGPQSHPSLAFDGINYLVVWQDGRGSNSDIYGVLVSTSGTVSDPAGIAISTEPFDDYYPATTFGNTNYLVVSQTRYDIFGVRVEASGSVLDPDGIVVSTAANRQFSPATAFGETRYLITWQDDRNGEWDIYGSRVSSDGVVLDPDGIAISTALNEQYSPGVSFDGTNYLVVWEDYRGGGWDVYGSRVSTDGVVLDPDGIAISTGPDFQFSPAVAFDGTNYLIVWCDRRTGAYDIYGTRLSVGGIVLDPAGTSMSSAPNSQASPAVAFDGDSYFAVWEDYRNGNQGDIYGTRITTSGTVLDPEGIAISTTARDQNHAAIDFDGVNYLIVWDEPWTGGRDIYGARVSADGAVLDAEDIAISEAIGEQHLPTVVFDGTAYLVLWRDYRGGNDCDIYAARMTVGGEVIDPSGMPIAIGQGNQWEPDATLGLRDSLLLTHASFTPPPYGSYRVWGSFWADPGATGLTFASASASGNRGYVSLSWQMAVDVPASSFVVERSESRSGGYQTLDVPIFEDSPLLFSCADYAVQTDKNYWYKIALIASTGEEVYGPIEVYVSPVPVVYGLSQNYPNPFNPACLIRYDIPLGGKVTLEVFDVSGSLVSTLVDARRDPGSYSELWNGRAEDGGELPSGVYFYRLEAGGFVATRKMVLLK